MKKCLQKKRIFLFPYDISNNRYIQDLIDSLRDKDMIIIGENKKKEILFSNYNIAYFNWLENQIVSNKKIISLFRLYLVKVLLFILRARGKKIVWTYHNKFPHENKFSDIGKKVMDIMYNNSDVVIVHSKYAKQYCRELYSNVDKIMYINHPNYLNSYKPIDKNIDTEIINIGFFGAIRPYKNIEILINMFKSIKSKKIRLSIYGKPYNKSYKEEILELCKEDSRINLDLRFIDDEEISNIFSTIDILFLSYGEESFLTSGSAMLSFSLKTPIIAPKLAMFEDYKDKSYAFLYSDIEEVKTIIDNISSMDRQRILQLGEQAFSHAQKNSWKQMAENLDIRLNEIL